MFIQYCTVTGNISHTLVRQYSYAPFYCVFNSRARVARSVDHGSDNAKIAIIHTDSGSNPYTTQIFSVPVFWIRRRTARVGLVPALNKCQKCLNSSVRINRVSDYGGSTMWIILEYVNVIKFYYFISCNVHRQIHIA